MSGYGISLFLHLLGVIGLTSAIIMMHGIGSKIRGAPTVQDLRLWLGVGRSVQVFFPVSGILLLVTGLHLAGAGWDFGQPWILTALILVLLLLPAAPVVQRPRFMAMGMAAGSAAPGAVPPDVSRLTLDPFPWRWHSMMTGVSIGLLWIMTLKPGTWIGALVPPLALAVAGWLLGGTLVQGRQAVPAPEGAATAKR
jgi:hypothetical protein